MTDNGPAAWLADPAGRAEYRWWDGTQWTDHVATGGVPSVDPAPVPVPPQGPGVPPAVPEPTTPTVPEAPTLPAASVPSEASVGWQVPEASEEPALTNSIDERSRRPWLVPVLLAGAALLAVGAGAAMLLGGGDSADPTTVQALLEPADELGPDPFTEDFAAQPVITIPSDVVAPLPDTPAITTTESTGVDPTTSESATTVAATDGAIVRVNAATPGLYGGTQDNDRCNTSQLQSFLADHPDKATAWVDALNGDDSINFGGAAITVDDIGSYIDTLTPVVLLADTLVVNHGYVDGRATPHDSVLQKGSAVLVDEQGVPRTRCACGNPLTQPSPSATQVEPQGTPWPGYNPNKVAVVEPFPGGMTALSVVDLQSGGLFERPMGTKGGSDIPPSTTTTTAQPATTEPTTTTTVVLGTGDVQATLRWNSDTDLDLHLIDPDGEEIAWTSPGSTSGGVLDVDDVPAAGDNGPHVENIFWPPGEAPTGAYQVWVHHFDGQAADYTLEVRVNDEVIHSESGTLSVGGDSARFDFTR